MIRKHDNLNEQKYCYGNHHCPLTSASLTPGALIGCPDAPEESAQPRGKRVIGVVWQGGLSVTVRWLCPRIRFSVWGKGEDGSSWPRCSSPSLGGQMHFAACTDSSPGACPRSCPQEEASPEISAGVGVVWSGSPCRGCVSSQSALAWCCLHRSTASGASDGQRKGIK